MIFITTFCKLLRRLIIVFGQLDILQPVYCEICRLNPTENWADSNDTITQLEKQLEQVCSVVPAAYQAICTYAVEQYLPTFVHQIEQEYPPLKCCQEVGLCSAAPAVVAPVAASAELCPICKAAVGFLKTKIGTFDVQAVKQQLDFACSFFKIADCQALVDKAAEIAENLQTEDAQTICSTVVDVCPKAAQVTFNPFKKFLEAKNSAYCPTCLRLTEYLEDVVVSDLAVKELEKIANEGCAKLGEFQSLCQKFVPLAVEELKNLLLKKLTPQKVCSTLKMCDAQEIALHAAAAASNELCLGCEYIISVADNWLIANNTQKSVKDTLDMVCNDFVPSPYKAQCVALVDQYAAELTQLFENKVFNPQTVCKAIGVCTASQQRAAIKMN